MFAFIKIDYDEFDTDSYRGTILNVSDTQITKEKSFTLDTGNALRDLNIIYNLAYIFAEDMVYHSSSVDNFFMDLQRGNEYDKSEQSIFE